MRDAVVIEIIKTGNLLRPVVHIESRTEAYLPWLNDIARRALEMLKYEEKQEPTP